MAAHTFTADVWAWEAQAAWRFVTLPEDLSDEIDGMVQCRPTRGFGSVRVEVTVGSTTWRTSIFPDATRSAFVLPLKKAVRQAEGLADGVVATVTMQVLDV
jgi:hypothetical protein